MSIGTGIVLFVIGAILAFALNVQLDWVNLDLVGYILMAAGALTAIVGIIVMVSRRGRTRGTTTVVEDDRI